MPMLPYCAIPVESGSSSAHAQSLGEFRQRFPSLGKSGSEHVAAVRLACLAALFENSFQEAWDFEDSLIFHSRGIVAITRQGSRFDQLRNGFIDVAKTVQHNAGFVFENPIRVVTLLRQRPCVSFRSREAASQGLRLNFRGRACR